MNTKFNKQETIKLLEEYYERLEERKVRVSIDSRVDYIGIYETKSCITTITVTECLEIAGMKKDVNYELSREELTHNITAILNLYDLEVKSLSLDDGFSSHCEGYGMMEHDVNKAYCNGIDVKLSKKKNKEYTK